jgi:hypothetical protein
MYNSNAAFEIPQEIPGLPVSTYTLNPMNVQLHDKSVCDVLVSLRRILSNTNRPIGRPTPSANLTLGQFERFRSNFTERLLTYFISGLRT